MPVEYPSGTICLMPVSCAKAGSIQNNVNTIAIICLLIFVTESLLSDMLGFNMFKTEDV
jgi:hypothetical protein